MGACIGLIAGTDAAEQFSRGPWEGVRGVGKPSGKSVRELSSKMSIELVEGAQGDGDDAFYVSVGEVCD